jgi:hypothetical protein
MSFDLYQTVRGIAEDLSNFYEPYLPPKVREILNGFAGKDNEKAVDKYIHLEIVEDYTARKFWKNKVFSIEAYLESARNPGIPMFTYTQRTFDELVLSRQTENLREIIYDYKRILIKADWETLEYQDGERWLPSVNDFRQALAHELMHLLAHYDYLSLPYSPPAHEFQKYIFYTIVEEGVPEYLTRRLLNIDLTNKDYPYWQFTSAFPFLSFWSAGISKKGATREIGMDTLIPHIYFSGKDAKIFGTGKVNGENWRKATTKFEEAVRAQLSKFTSTQTSA